MKTHDTYEVITAKDCAELETSVNKKLVEGWQLLGGIAIGIADSSEAGRQQTQTFTQAVMKAPQRTESVRDRPTKDIEALEAGLLGVSVVALLQMLSLPTLDMALTVALYSFIVAIPSVAVFLLHVTTLEVHTMDAVIESFWMSLASIIGPVAAFTGIVSSCFHFSIYMGGLFLVFSIITFVALITAPKRFQKTSLAIEK
jgi:hypothetical protein